MHNVGVAFSRNLFADYPRASSVVFAAVGVYGLAFDWTDRNLTGTDKVMGTLIFGLLAVGCTGNLIRLLLRGHPATRLHRRPGRGWRAFHSEVVLPPSRTSSSDGITGQRLSGVGLPLRSAGRPWMPMFVGLVGAALLFCGLFIGVSGTGVTGGHWARWVAMVLLSLPGALCIAGSVLVLAGPTITPADQVVLTPQVFVRDPAAGLGGCSTSPGCTRGKGLEPSTGGGVICATPRSRCCWSTSGRPRRRRVGDS